MIDALNHELITWLGFLQRGSVLLQLAILLITVMLEKRSRLTRRLNSELMRSVSHLIAPGALIVLGAAMKVSTSPLLLTAAVCHQAIIFQMPLALHLSLGQA